jgi:Skp family chaperone for outer membrane proteins
MNLSRALLASVLLVTGLVAGCSQPQDEDSIPVVVIDLEEIAKAIGQDVVIEEELAAAREELNAQLVVMAAELEAMLEEEKTKLGTSPDQAQQEAFDRIQLEAQQQFAQAQAQAQQEAQQFQAGLVNEFHQQVKPVAARISAQHGARITLLANSSAFWFDSSADITEEIVAALQTEMADGPTADSEDSDSAEDSDDDSDDDDSDDDDSDEAE